MKKPTRPATGRIGFRETRLSWSEYGLQEAVEKSKSAKPQPEEGVAGGHSVGVVRMVSVRQNPRLKPTRLTYLQVAGDESPVLLVSGNPKLQPGVVIQFQTFLCEPSRHQALRLPENPFAATHLLNADPMIATKWRIQQLVVESAGGRCVIVFFRETPDLCDGLAHASCYSIRTGIITQ